MAKKIRGLVFLLLAVGIWIFIFSNSMQGGDESNALSGWWTEFLRPLLNPNGWLTEDVYHMLIRKLAHFAEFGALGLCLTGAAVNFECSWLWPVGLGILTAVCDETLQSFTGRACRVTDMMIDSAGVFCGVIFVIALCEILKRHRERSI